MRIGHWLRRNKKRNLGTSLIERCPTCDIQINDGVMDGAQYRHNVETCRLVNLALFELGVSVDRPVQIDVYPYSGPLRGYYLTSDPYTIHVSESTYAQFPQYIIFHETKHLVDCLTKGWSEESTPDPFARSLCEKYGYRCPPAHPQWEPFAWPGFSVRVS